MTTAHNLADHPTDNKPVVYRQKENAVQVSPLVRVNVRGAYISPAATIDDLTDIASKLDDVSQDIKWTRGDLVLYADGKWGDEGRQIIPAKETDNWVRYARLSSIYPYEERYHNVCWSMYDAVRNREDRHELLEMAEAKQWSVATMNLYLKGDQDERVSIRELYDKLLDHTALAIRQLKDGEESSVVIATLESGME